jgi:putative phosphoribosyl transferase
MIFKNRKTGGKQLAERLSQSEWPDNLIVLALSKGGVPVAFQVAKALKAPMDVFVVRKLGVPGHEETAIGAIASGGIRIINETAVKQAGLSEKDIAASAAQEQLLLERLELLYRRNRPSIKLQGRPVIVVDDGMATGSTMLAAVLALRELGPSEIIVAVPVTSEDACFKLKQSADRVVCLSTPSPFTSIDQWYDNFRQTTDEEVLSLLGKAKKP